jgi:Tfp pilus assembly protein PilF
MLITPILAFALLGVQKAPPVQINVDIKDGEVISVERKFRVTVQSQSPITSVEFYVGDNLRDSDTSTPYEFKIDPLSEKEGDLKLAFAAYNTEGQNARKTFTVKIDTGVSKGAEFHVQRAREFLTESKWDDAINAGKIALRADPKYNPARVVMARAYFGKGVMDEAQHFAEDAVEADPDFAEGRELLAAINLQRAFNTYNRGGSKKETLEAISSALKAAVEYRRKNLDTDFDKFGEPTDENRLRYADIAIRTGRFSAVTQALQQAFLRSPDNTALGSRLAYAQMRAGRLNDAHTTLSALKKADSMDAYSYALLAVVEASIGRDSASDEAMKEAIANDSEDRGVLSAQAYIALKRGRRDTLNAIASNMAKDMGARTETNYYLSILYNQLGEFRRSDERFERAVLAEPTNYSMFIERGNQALMPVAMGRVSDKEQIAYQFQIADAFFQAALLAKNDSPEALTAVAISHSLQGRPADAVRFAQAATAAGANYAAAHYVASMIYAASSSNSLNRADAIRREARSGVTAEQRKQIDDLTRQADELNKLSTAAKAKAEQLDPNVLKGRGVPNLQQAFEYFQRHGRIPLMTAPK